jgi:hypothetical protein
VNGDLIDPKAFDEQLFVSVLAGAVIAPSNSFRET